MKRTSVLIPMILAACNMPVHQTNPDCAIGTVATWTGAQWLCVTPAVPSDAGTIPCGPNPCDDGAGDVLQDVGEHCGGDDWHDAPPGVATCCHGLVCADVTGAFPINSEMGACARGSVAAPPVCPKNPILWLYQCDGSFVPKTALMTPIVWTGRFTGPPPSQITAQGGVNAWMKIAFAANFPTIHYNGTTYYFLAAKNCYDLGPMPSP